MVSDFISFITNSELVLLLNSDKAYAAIATGGNWDNAFKANNEKGFDNH